MPTWQIHTTINSHSNHDGSIQVKWTVKNWLITILTQKKQRNEYAGEMSLANLITIVIDWDRKHKSHIQRKRVFDVHAHVFIRHSRKSCRLDRFTQTK